MQTMTVDDFITEYCNPNCDKGGQGDCCVSFDGSCKLCTPDSIMTTCLYLDAAGDRVGQDAALERSKT